MPTHEQILEYKKQYRLKNKEKIKEYRKSHYRASTIKKHKLTIEKHDNLFNEQKGKCAICGVHQGELKQALCIDHNHITNEVRGLLCSKCNRGLGYLQDNINILQNAIDYLKKHLEIPDKSCNIF